MEWHLSPEDAVLRLLKDGRETVVTACAGRVSIPVVTGFYSVSVTAPGHEPWERRIALGGSRTNLTVVLAPEAPPPPPPVEQKEPEPPPPPKKREPPRRLVLDDTPPPAPTPPPPEPTPTVPATPVPVVAVSSPIVAVPSPVPASQPPPPTPADGLQPTQLVRVLLESTVQGDDGLFTTPKTLSIGNETRAFGGVSLTLPYAEVQRRPLALRARAYHVGPPLLNGVPAPGACVPVRTPDGLAELVFRAFPQEASVRFSAIDSATEVWDAGSMRKLTGYDNRTRVLRLAPYTGTVLTLRRRGRQPLAVEIRPQRPGTEAVCEAAPLWLPVYGASGDRVRIDLGGCDLVVRWIPGGIVRDGTAQLHVPRGFWMAEHPLTRRQWASTLGLTLPSAPDSAIRSGRSSFEAWASALSAAEPRLAVRLPTRAERLRASQEGVAFEGTASNATSPDATGPFHPVLVMALPDASRR